MIRKIMRINESLRGMIWDDDWTLRSVPWGQRHLKQTLRMVRWRFDNERRWFWDYNPSNKNAQTILNIVKDLQDGRWKI